MGVFSHIMNLRHLILPLVVSLACTLSAEPVKVAIVSDSEAARADWSQLLKQRGAEVVNLDKAEVLVLNGNPAGLEQEAVEAFARRGGGLVAVHGGVIEGGAAWWKPLLGGAWAEQSRKFSSRMMLYTLTDGHPIMHDVSPFDIDDDTSYDLDTDPAITVLASAFTPKVTSKKVDSRSPPNASRANIYDLQPQAWTYEGGDKHRAFVLLQGAAATLKHTSIQTFILRAITWTAKRPNVDELVSKDELTTLRYPQDGPRRPADTVKQFQLEPGFKATAIASEPLINKPIAMQWDAKGRLWIAETPEYPNGRRPMVTEAWKETGVLVPDNYDRPARDRISVLEDTDGDGVLDKKTVFHTGLELVTGFCLYGDGVIAVGQPDIVFLHDTKGEGRCDKEEPLYTGFTPGDTHFVANHFIVAPDGWIYADTGSGPEVHSVAHPEVKARLGSGMFRFKADGTAIEQVSSKGGNGFGAEVTSEGELFFGQATSGSPVQHVVLPEWILTKGKVGSTGSAQSVIENRKVIRPDMPDRAALMQIDVVGGYSSATASALYEGGAWPAEYDHGIFCTEPILDIIHHEKLVPAGPTFTGEMTRTDREWLRSMDYWFFPVDVSFGPDGAMYVLDFYCPVVAHSDTRGPQHSKAGASIRPDRDHYFGRIYRIQSNQAKKLTLPDLSKASANELVQAFDRSNKLTRFTAHRLLMDRKDAASALPALNTMAEGDAFTPGRILALWALQRLDKLTPATLQKAFQSSDANLRKAALLVAEAAGPKANAADVTALFKDTNARVRLTALRAMASVPMTTESAAALLAILPNLEDEWSKSAAVAAASSNAGPVLEAALALKEAPSNALLDLAKSLSTSLAENKDAIAISRIVVAASKADPAAAPLATTVFEAAGAHLPLLAGAVSNPANLTDALKALLDSKDVALVASVLPIAVAWDASAEMKKVSAEKMKMFLALAGDPAQSDAVRGAEARALVRSRTADATAIPAVIALLKTKLSDGLAADVIGALLGTEDDALGKSLVALLPNLSPLGQTALYDGLVSRIAWANAALDALETKELPITLLGPARLSKLRLHPDPVVAKRAVKLIEALGGGTNPKKDEIIAKLLPLIDSKPGDLAKGKLAFTAICSVCHKLNGVGQEVGPPLDGIGVHGTAELLIHIIDPSRVVDNEHRTWSIALKNGTFATGIIARENDRAITLHLPGGASQDIKLADIKSRQDTGLSLMPEGFEGLGADMLRDILAYLSGGTSKYRAINLGKTFTTDTLQGLYNSREAKEDTVQPEHYGVVTVEGVPFSLPDPSTTPTGGNVIVLKGGGKGTYAYTLPQRVEIPLGYPVGNLHFLSGVAGWGGGADTHRPSMKLTITYADGKTQVEEMYSGDIFIDYPSGDDVPGSKRAVGVVKKKHIRYFSVPVEQRGVVKSIALESYNNGIAPTTLAITTDNDAPLPHRKYGTEAPASAALPKSGETLPAKAEPRIIRALLIGGGSSHDFERYFHKADSATLRAAGIVTAYTSNVEEALALMPNADVIVLSANHGSFGLAPFQRALNAFADAGHGLVIVHAGTWHNWPEKTNFNTRFLGGGARGHGFGDFQVLDKAPAHPVMQGVPDTFTIHDEHYKVELDAGTPTEVLAMTSVEPQSKKAYPSVWVVKDAKAKIVGIGLGHADEAHSNPAYQKILANAVRWVAGK